METQPARVKAYDIDGVLANFIHGFLARGAELGFADSLPKSYREWNSWNPLHQVENGREIYNQMWKSIETDHAFWLGLPIYDEDTLACIRETDADLYITSRPVPSEISHQWLVTNGAKDAPVITVPPGTSKVKAALEAGVTLMLEDAEHNFIELNKAGVLTYLLTRPSNANSDLGEFAHLRISSVREFIVL